MKRINAITLVLALLFSAGCAVNTPSEPEVISEPEPILIETPLLESEDIPQPVLTANITSKRILTSAEAAAKLNALGIMRGVEQKDGEIDYLLDDYVNRETAIVLIARALGHDNASDEAYPLSPFSDVDSWAVGAVNYAKAKGITNGVASSRLGSSYAITANEFATMLLRALGYSDDFYFSEAYDFALKKGIMEEIGSDKISRGDAAIAICNLISATAKDDDESLLETLLEAGVITEESVNAAGFSDIIKSADSTLLTGDEVLKENQDKLLVLSVYDKTGALIRKVHGAFIADNAAIVSFEDVYGAAFLSYTSGESEYEVSGISFYDENSGIVCFPVNEGAPKPHFDTPVEPETDTVYILSSVASIEEYKGEFTSILSAARPVIDARGNFIGFTQRGSRMLKADLDWVINDEPIPFKDFALTYWPETLYPRGLDPTKKMIAITFDDGPSRSVTPKILDLIEKYGVVATFFECGRMLKANPQYLERMEELGCEVGNHSYSHPNLNALPKDKVVAEIEDTNDIIESKLGHNAALVRAPYGNSNANVREVMDYPLIYWSVDTLDWQSRSSTAVFNKITGNSYDGAIILMHSLYDSTYNACVKAIPWLLEQGYQLVTVSEMAECRGFDLEPGTIYYSFPQK